MAKHIITVKLANGERARFHRVLDDSEFESLAADIGGVMPRRFKATHLEDGELIKGSARVDVLKEFPIVCVGRDCAHAEPVEYVKAAKRLEDQPDSTGVEIDFVKDLLYKENLPAVLPELPRIDRTVNFWRL
jgi:hypothetical protein